MWLVFALITAIFWAIGSALIKKTTVNLHNSVTYFLNASFFLAGWLIYRLFDGNFVWDFVSTLIAILPGLGFIYVLTAFSKAEVGLVTAVGSINPAITALLAVTFLGENLNPIQAGLISAIVFGVMVMSLPNKIKPTKSTRWLEWGLGFGLLSGLINLMMKLAISRSSTFSFSLTTALWQILVALIWLSFSHQKQALKGLNTKKGRIGLLGTGLFNLGSMSSLLAIGAGKVSLVMPVVNMYVPLLLLFSTIWLKEKLTLRQIVGAVAVVVCVAWLSLIS